MSPPNMETSASTTSTPIKVAVRVRPFSKSDADDGAKSVVSVDQERRCIAIVNPTTSESKEFAFDFVYDSFVDPDSPAHASQETLWNDLGSELLAAAWDGYNYSLFAYGQTGSGKSHSMLGFGEENEKKGILPRACEAIFARIAESEESSSASSSSSSDAGDGARDVSFKVEATMLEIYNERIRDLLVPPARQGKRGGAGLRVRDSPETGAYVEGLKRIPVSSSGQIKSLIEFGTRNRTVAATNMNETSSRAHTIFTIGLVKTTVDRNTMKASNKTSLISLVDLAGSERIGKTGAEGDRLKEGGHINKSLSSLGNVINALAEKAKGKKHVVPYRDSVLTHLLKKSLGGNSKTTMIAAISPADTDFSESLSTLRYANRTKQIKNTAVVNEDPNDKLIRHLREEMERLRQQLKDNPSRDEIKAEMEAAFRLELDQKRAEWEKHQREADAALRTEAGVDNRGDTAPSDLPYLSNLNEDAALTDKLRFYLEEASERTVTSLNESDRQDQELLIPLGGLGILPMHATVEHRIDGHDASRLVLRAKEGARTMVNGVPVAPKLDVEVHHNDRIIFGQNCIFKVVIPTESSSGAGEELHIDWEFALKEANAAVIGRLEAENREHSEAAERIRFAMEQKVRSLEEQLRLERKRLSKDGATKEDMLQKQKELEQRLANQILENEKFTNQQERERKERSIIDRHLLHTLPLVHEANSISTSLKKDLTFKVKLLSKASNQSFSDGAFGSEMTKDCYSTEICIVACNSTASHRNLWSLDKFNARVYVMREMYQTWIYNNQSLEGTDFDTLDSDPFYDPPEDQLLGVARIQLEALKYVLDIHEHTPIVDYSGRSQGELEVVMVPSVPHSRMDIEDLEEVIGEYFNIIIKVESARGLAFEAVNSFRSLFVRWKFLSAEWTESKRVPLVSINPAISYQTRVQAQVTKESCAFFSNAALCIEVWASVDEPCDQAKVWASVDEPCDQESDKLHCGKAREEWASTGGLHTDNKMARLWEENERLKEHNKELERKLSAALEQVAVLRRRDKSGI